MNPPFPAETRSPSQAPLAQSAKRPELRASDSVLVELLRTNGKTGVGELASSLQVTATAVRQRLERLMREGIVTREVVVTFDSESEEGDEARDPLLRVYHLDADGALTPLSGDIGFGGTDDATGAVRGATWVVDEALLLPRDLYVQVQPERPGPGGSAPPFVVRRTYHLQGPRLVLVDETSSPLRPRSPAATHAAHSAQ